MAYYDEGNSQFHRDNPPNQANQPNSANQPNNPKKPEKPDLGFWMLIGVMFLTGLWPLSLILLISKLSDGSRSKKPAASRSAAAPTAQQHSTEERSKAKAAQTAKTAQSKAAQAMASITKTPQYGSKGSKAMKIVGLALALIGAIVMMAQLAEFSPGFYFRNPEYIFEDFWVALGFLSGGISLLLGGRNMRRRSRRFAKYLAAAGNRDVIDINDLAQAAEVSEYKAEKDLEIMVEKGLWGPTAYVDSGRNMLFLSQAAADAYFQNKKKKKKTTAAAPPPQAEQGYSGMLRNIRRANDRISDPELSVKIDRLEEITARIFKAIENDPSRQEKASTFLKYYLPTTQKLLDSYADFEEAGVSGENLSQAKAKIEKTMDNIVSGFEHQLDQLYQADAMDVDSDIRVMETMLRRDTATVEDDFGLHADTAQDGFGLGSSAVAEWDQE